MKRGSSAGTRADNYAESFAPVLGRAPRILILGSMPGRQSLDAAQYYAHARNAFWRVMAALIDLDPAAPYALRLDALRSSGIALWDVLHHCERPGSLDARIRRESAVANDFAGLFHEFPGIQAIFCNGATAHETWRRQVLSGLPAPHAGKPCIRLPSTSPAHAAMSLQQKIDAWCDEIRPYLG